MTIAHCDLALSTGLNDGTSWANAYQGAAGLVTGAAALAAGDTIYVKNTITGAVTTIIIGPTTLASKTNPLRIKGVKSGTTNEGGSIVQSDLIPGVRTGESTRAYAWGGGTVPKITASDAGGSDVQISGSTYIYGMIFQANDNINLASGVGSVVTLEECEYIVISAGDLLGSGASNADEHILKTIRCKFNATAGNLRLTGSIRWKDFDSDFDCTDVGSFTTVEFVGIAELHASDLSGCDATLFDIASFNGGVVELHTCKMPANHILTTGTATGSYTVNNYGSEDSTGLTTGGSEQALEMHTHQGTVDIETTVVRTGGATDLAAGLFAYAVVANNVTENFVGVEIPLRDIWVEGDGTAKTYLVHIANSLAESSPANDLHDSEVYLRLEYPSEAGLSMYDYLPNEGAPGDGGGRAQLLGTPADLANHSGTTWAANGNNEQEISNSIAPDYEGVVHGTLVFSSTRSLTLYVDPLPVIT